MDFDSIYDEFVNETDKLVTEARKSNGDYILKYALLGIYSQFDYALHQMLNLMNKTFNSKNDKTLFELLNSEVHKDEIFENIIRYNNIHMSTDPVKLTQILKEVLNEKQIPNTTESLYGFDYYQINKKFASYNYMIDLNNAEIGIWIKHSNIRNKLAHGQYGAKIDGQTLWEYKEECIDLLTKVLLEAKN